MKAMNDGNYSSLVDNLLTEDVSLVNLDGKQMREMDAEFGDWVDADNLDELVRSVCDSVDAYLNTSTERADVEDVIGL